MEDTDRLAHARAALRITVPTEDVLGEPISLERGENGPSYDYSPLAQLPTPITNHGAFQPLEVAKRNPGSSPSTNTRVVSEFQRRRLVSRAGMRHISNPTLMPANELFPLPPMELATVQFAGREFVAPHLGRMYRFVQVVGSGAFSTVVAAENTAQQGDLVAVKIVTVPTDDTTSVRNFRLYICRELGILTHLQHPGVISLLDYSLSLLLTEEEIEACFFGREEQHAGADMYDLYSTKVANEQCFFLQYAPGGSLLLWLLHNSRAMHSIHFWRLMRRVVAELVVTVAYLHSKLVVHRDIKLENVLLTADYDIEESEGEQLAEESFKLSSVCTLTDFGLSKKLSHEGQLLATKCGSQDYVSPELLMGLSYDGALLDSWALGVLTYCILEDRLPFDMPPPELASASGMSPSVLKRRQNKNNPAYRIATIDWDWYRASILQKDTSLSDEAHQIITQLMELVGLLLVRKERRVLASNFLDRAGFEWIKALVPSSYLAWRG